MRILLDTSVLVAAMHEGRPDVGDFRRIAPEMADKINPP